MRVQRVSLKTLELVRAYSVPIRDEWYVSALQKTVDLIWNNIEWKYRFPKLVRRGGKLITIMGSKMVSQ